MARFCGNCGSPLNETAMFCGKCGNKVPVAAASFAPPPPPPSPPAMGGFQPVQPVLTPPPSAVEPFGFAPVSPAITPSQPADPPSFAPMPAAFTPPPPTEDFSGFTPLPTNFTPPTPEDRSGFSAIPTGFTPPPPAENFSSFATVPPAFTPAPPAHSSSFEPIPAAFTPPPPAKDFSSFAPVSTAFASPSTPADTFDFAPQQPAFTPPSAPDPIRFAPPAPPLSPVNYSSTSMPTPAPSSPASYAPVANAAPGSSPNYAPIPGAGVPPPGQMNYAPIPGATPVAGYAPAQPIPFPAKKSNTLLKVVVAFVLIIFVGGALALAGLWYAAQQIKAKAHQVAAQALSGGAKPGGLAGLLGDSASDDENPGGFKGDPCRFLSTAEVSQAIGVQVIRAEGKEGGCTYIAKGDPADATAKHMSSMLGGMGADAKSQKMAQQFAGAFFAQQEAGDKDLKAQAATGEIAVLGLIFTAGHAEMEMKANRAGFASIAPFGAGQGKGPASATGDLTGIGDQAFVVGGTSLMMRKGNTMARMMYNMCPCNTTNIIPLARTLASRL